ncbi:hypothetical protein [Nitrosomonas communis]|nr:hypothetical protein [Nitrosomonas communis]
MSNAPEGILQQVQQVANQAQWGRFIYSWVAQLQNAMTFQLSL